MYFIFKSVHFQSRLKLNSSFNIMFFCVHIKSMSSGDGEKCYTKIYR